MGLRLARRRAIGKGLGAGFQRLGRLQKQRDIMRVVGLDGVLPKLPGQTKKVTQLLGFWTGTHDQLPKFPFKMITSQEGFGAKGTQGFWLMVTML
jgi:hypothetical protein